VNLRRGKVDSLRARFVVEKIHNAAICRLTGFEPKLFSDKMRFLFVSCHFSGIFGGKSPPSTLREYRSGLWSIGSTR